MAGRHRAPGSPRERNLMFAVILAALIATAGVLAVALTGQPPAPAPPSVATTEPAIRTTAAPTTTRTPRDVWHSCRTRTTDSTHPGTDAAECFLDNQVGVLMSCLVHDPQCPTTTKENPWQ